MLGLLVTCNITLPSEYLFALIAGKDEAFIMDGFNVSIQVTLRFKGDATLRAFEWPNVIMNGLDVSPKKTSLPKRPTAFVALEVPLFVVNRSHMNADVMLARKAFLAQCTREHDFYGFRFISFGLILV